MWWANLIVIIHVLAAMTWVGGLIFLTIVVVPGTRKLDPAARSVVLTGLGRRFRLVGWVSLGILLVTGLLNAGRFGYTMTGLVRGEWAASEFGRMLLAKLGLVFVVLLLTGAHDTFSRSSGSLRTSLSRMTALLNVLLSIIIVILATLLVRPLR